MFDKLRARAAARAAQKRRAVIARIMARVPMGLRAQEVAAGIRLSARRLRWQLLTRPGIWGFWR